MIGQVTRYASELSFERIAHTLRKPELSGLLFVLANHGGQIAIRILSTIILTRLLAPEAFGQILIVTTIAALVTLCSEVGLRGSVINHIRGKADSAYVNTVWTLMILQHVLIAGIIAGSSLFIETLYPGNHELREALWIAALISLVSGFSSTKIYQMEKELKLFLPSLLLLLKRFSALIFSVIFCYLWPSALSILWADVVAALLFVGCSHLFGKGIANRLTLDRTAVRTVFSYGKWILPATILTWATREGHKLATSFVLVASTLGFFAIASNVGLLVSGVCATLGEKWLFPVLAKHRSHQALNVLALKIRVVILLAAVTGLSVLITAADFLVALIYTDTYSAVAPLLAVVAAGSMGIVVANCYMPIFKAKADSRGLFRVRAIQSVALAVGIAVGYTAGDAAGMLLGIGYAQLLGGILTALSTYRHFPQRLYLLDSIAFTAPMAIWLYFLYEPLQRVIGQ